MAHYLTLLTLWICLLNTPAFGMGLTGSTPSTSGAAPASKAAPTGGTAPNIPLKPNLRHPPSTPPQPKPQVEHPPVPQGVSETETDAIFQLIQNAINAVQSKDYAKAYLNYTSAPFREKTSLDEFKYFASHYRVFTKNKNALFGVPEFRKNRALVKGTLTSMDGTTYKAEFFFIHEGNQWKILGIHLIPPTQGAEELPAPSHTPPPPQTHDYNFQSDISS